MLDLRPGTRSRLERAPSGPAPARGLVGLLPLPLLLFAVGLALALPARAAVQDVHATRTDRVREQLGLGDEEPPPEGLDVGALLEQHFVRAPAGGTQLYMSKQALHDAEAAVRLVELAREVLAGQAAWLEWVPASKDEHKQLEKDLAALDKWYSRLKERTLVKGLAETGAGDLLALLEAKDDVVEASARLTEFLASGRNLGGEPGRAPLRIVLMPDRGEFVDWISFAGWANPASRGEFHVEGTDRWTHFYLKDVRVYSLRHADGSSMDTEKNPNATREQVLQLAMGALLDHWYGGELPMTLIGGLALNLVVEVHEECDTRLDGDLRARQTQRWETFVPGGLSEGGVLPAMPATTRWREFHGAHHFTSLLRRAQKDGEEDMRRAGGGNHYFRLLADDGVKTRVVEAPFLGPAAGGREVPSGEFAGDWLEFVRAYRSCFLHWLRTEAGGNARKSATAFADLCARLAAATTPEEADAAFAEVFEVEGLSSAELGTDTLEGRFLRWLERQK